MLTLAATTAYATGEAGAQEQPLKAQLINHVSYTCPNFKEAADWYSKVFNLDQVGPTNRDVALPFGKKDDPALWGDRQGRAAELPDHPHAQRQCATTPRRPAPRPKAQATIDHIGYTVADFKPRPRQGRADRDGRQETCAKPAATA